MRNSIFSSLPRRIPNSVLAATVLLSACAPQLEDAKVSVSAHGSVSSSGSTGVLPPKFSSPTETAPIQALLFPDSDRPTVQWTDLTPGSSYELSQIESYRRSTSENGVRREYLFRYTLSETGRLQPASDSWEFDLDWPVNGSMPIFPASTELPMEQGYADVLPLSFRVGTDSMVAGDKAQLAWRTNNREIFPRFLYLESDPHWISADNIKGHSLVEDLFSTRALSADSKNYAISSLWTSGFIESPESSELVLWVSLPTHFQRRASFPSHARIFKFTYTRNHRRELPESLKNRDKDQFLVRIPAECGTADTLPCQESRLAQRDSGPNFPDQSQAPSTWTLVARSRIHEVWRDDSTGALWSDVVTLSPHNRGWTDSVPDTHFSEGSAAPCSSLLASSSSRWELPTPEDLDAALARGLPLVLPLPYESQAWWVLQDGKPKTTQCLPGEEKSENCTHARLICTTPALAISDPKNKASEAVRNWISKGQVASLKSFANRGFNDWNAKYEDGSTAISLLLMQANESWAADLLAALVAKKRVQIPWADLVSTRKEHVGITLFQAAIALLDPTHFNAITQGIEERFDPKSLAAARTTEGNTALHLLARTSGVDRLQWLIEKGHADLFTPNLKGQRAYDVAVEFGEKEMARALLSYEKSWAKKQVKEGLTVKKTSAKMSVPKNRPAAPKKKATKREIRNEET